MNVEDHEQHTGREIIQQAPAPIDAFVAGYGTGGTLAGCGKAIKAAYPSARILAMEPAEAALLAGESPCCHFIEGVADGFIPPLLRGAPLDGEVKVIKSSFPDWLTWVNSRAEPPTERYETGSNILRADRSLVFPSCDG